MNEHAQTAGGFAVGRTTLGGVTILSPSASLTFENCAGLRSALEAASDGKTSKVVLDCQAVAFMDSAGLELLVEFHEKLRANRGEFRLTHLNDVCSDILTVSRLVHTLVVCEGINQALKDG